MNYLLHQVIKSTENHFLKDPKKGICILDSINNCWIEKKNE